MLIKRSSIFSLLYLLPFLSIYVGTLNEMEIPKGFENIKILYTSPNEISKYRIIVDYYNIIFYDNGLKIVNITEKNKKIRDLNIIYKDLKPLNNFRYNNHYFAKNCIVYRYQYLLSALETKYTIFSFPQLGNLDCNIEMYCVDVTGVLCVYYSKNNNKIIVFDEDTKKSQEIVMESNIIQALIYSYIDKEKNKSWEFILIGIDSAGTLFFYPIISITFIFPKKIPLYINNNVDNDIAGFVGKDKNKLLIINNDNFILIDLINLKTLTDKKLKNEIKDISAFLALDDGNAIIGTNNGYIFLIEYNEDNDSINILDKYQICKNKRIKNLNYDIGCHECISNKEECYKIAVNCGIIKLFTFYNKNSEITIIKELIFELISKYKLYSIILLIIVILIILLILKFLKKKFCSDSYKFERLI